MQHYNHFHYNIRRDDYAKSDIIKEKCKTNESENITLEKTIKKKIGLRVKNLGCVFSRIFKENKQFLLMYYLCESIGGKEKPSKDLTELKWVKPEELEGYFTTSFDKRLKEYIMNLK